MAMVKLFFGNPHMLALLKMGISNPIILGMLKSDPKIKRLQEKQNIFEDLLNNPDLLSQLMSPDLMNAFIQINDERAAEDKKINNTININNNIINNNIIKITNNNNFLNMNQKEFGYLSFSSQSNINKSPNSIVNNTKPKNLNLSGNLFFNKNVKITPNGIEKSMRNKNEFPIFFGTEPTVDKNGIPYNDYIVNYIPKKKVKKKSTNNSNNNNENNNEINEKENEKEKDKEDENINGGRIFQIFYDKIRNEYILNFIHNSLILYYRINKPIYFDFDKEYYFILGNVFLSVLVKKVNEKNNICIKVETEDQKAEKLNFENEKKLVIGRDGNSDVEIDKQCISKFHSTIEYDNIINLYYYKDNNSTNGSTLIIREDDSIIIKGSMYFKLEDTSFIIKEIE